MRRAGASPELPRIHRAGPCDCGTILPGLTLMSPVILRLSLYSAVPAPLPPHPQPVGVPPSQGCPHLFSGGIGGRNSGGWRLEAVLSVLREEPMCQPQAAPAGDRPSTRCPGLLELLLLPECLPGEWFSGSLHPTAQSQAQPGQGCPAVLVATARANCAIRPPLGGVGAPSH